MVNHYPYQFDFHAAGSGPTILFVPGSFSTMRAWDGVQKYLPPGYRFVTTSLCGCGGTEETRDFNNFHIDHLVRLIEAVAAKAGTPVHLVAHSCGGMVAYEAVLSGRIDILSLTTFETNNMTLLPAFGQVALHDDAYEVGQKFEQAYLAKDPDAAAAIIDFWGGSGAFAAMPEPIQAYIRKTALANVLDWRMAKTIQTDKARYAALKIPVQLVRGELANPVIKAVHSALSELIPHAQTAKVAGAGHFLINSHAKECAAVLQGFLSRL